MTDPAQVRMASGQVGPVVDDVGRQPGVGLVGGGVPVPALDVVGRHGARLLAGRERLHHPVGLVVVELDRR